MGIEVLALAGADILASLKPTLSGSLYGGYLKNMVAHLVFKSGQKGGYHNRNRGLGTERGSIVIHYPTIPVSLDEAKISDFLSHPIVWPYVLHEIIALPIYAPKAT